MSQTKDETRERIRSLVREVLESVPVEEDVRPQPGPERVIVNSLKEKFEREFDRDESAKELITEDDLRGLESRARVRVAEGAKFTPLARDIANDLELELIVKKPRGTVIKARSIAIGADHGGFEAKERLKEMLTDLGLKIRDLGTHSTEPVDYPDIAHSVATAVGSGRVDVGIIIDGAGIGSAMAANKVPGALAAACYSVELAKNAREHNGANILTLGSGRNSFDEIKSIVEAFLVSEISEERHKRRVSKIADVDRQYRR
jgi:ribose 5-phosphate isomerase B